MSTKCDHITLRRETRSYQEFYLSARDDVNRIIHVKGTCISGQRRLVNRSVSKRQSHIHAHRYACARARTHDVRSIVIIGYELLNSLGVAGHGSYARRTTNNLFWSRGLTCARARARTRRASRKAGPNVKRVY